MTIASNSAASNSAAKPLSTLRAVACEALMVSVPDTEINRSKDRTPTNASSRRARDSDRQPATASPASVHAVKTERAPGHYLTSCLRRQRREPVADHLRRTRKEAVLMRIIGRPH